MKKFYFLFVILFIQYNSQIKQNPIFLVESIEPFVLSTNDNYYYVDKTMYIEKLENLAEKRIMFLRPCKFWKTLFTRTLEYYYDIKAKDLL